MNQGVEIILKRMDSNPQEFEIGIDPGPYVDPNQSRWYWFLNPLLMRGNMLAFPQSHSEPAPPAPCTQLPFLSDEEVLVLYNKLMSIQGESFTQAVLRTVMQVDHERGEDHFMYALGGADTKKLPPKFYDVEKGKWVR